jgi:hypothetical protein
MIWNGEPGRLNPLFRDAPFFTVSRMSAIFRGTVLCREGRSQSNFFADVDDYQGRIIVRFRLIIDTLPGLSLLRNSLSVS